jgi:hypothetical protein
MDIISSGPHNSNKIKLNVLNGMQPPLPQAVVASFRGMAGLGELTAEERAAFADEVYARIQKGGGMPVAQQKTPWGLMLGFGAFIGFAAWMAFKK